MTTNFQVQAVAEITVVPAQALAIDVFVLPVVVDVAHDPVPVEFEIAFVTGAMVHHGVARDAVRRRSFRACAGIDAVVERLAVGDV